MSDNIEIENDGTESESSVITGLRKQLKEAEARAAEWDQARKEAADSQLAAAGFPKMSDVFLSKVPGIATAEKVAAFLEEHGLAKSVEEPKPTEGVTPEGSPANDLAALTGLGSQVASAASGGDKDALTAKILGAKNRQELAQVMAEAGLASHE